MVLHLMEVLLLLHMSTQHSFLHMVLLPQLHHQLITVLLHRHRISTAALVGVIIVWMVPLHCQRRSLKMS